MAQKRLEFKEKFRRLVGRLALTLSRFVNEVEVNIEDNWDDYIQANITANSSRGQMRFRAYTFPNSLPDTTKQMLSCLCDVIGNIHRRPYWCSENYGKITVYNNTPLFITLEIEFKVPSDWEKDSKALQVTVLALPTSGNAGNKVREVICEKTISLYDVFDFVAGVLSLDKETNEGGD
jgi:hypothetical protein